MVEPEAHIDWALGVRLAGGNEALAEELLEMLMRELPDRLRALREAQAAGDFTRLRESAHILHGATAYCGVPRLRLAVRLVEEAVQTGDAELVEPELEQLAAAAQALTAEYASRRLSR